MADFDIVKVAAERAKRTRAAKAETAKGAAEPKRISIVAPPKPVDTGTFIAPKHMDPLEDAVFAPVVVEEKPTDPPPVRGLSERTRAEIERGQKALARLR